MAENNPAEIPRTTLPRYAREAAELALQLATLSTEELERMLRTNRQIAATNRRRYRQFHGEEALPALLAYTGVVFRHIAPERFTPGDFEYAQQHLNITSFLYGLLRPLDAIRRYRLEGDAVLPGHDDQTMLETHPPRSAYHHARIPHPRGRPSENHRGLHENVPRGDDAPPYQKPDYGSGKAQRIRMGRVPVRRRAQPGRRLDVHGVTRPQGTEEHPFGGVSLPLVDEQKPVRPVTASFGQPQDAVERMRGECRRA